MRIHSRLTGFLLLLLALILCSSASAGTCITAMATSVDPDNLACTAVNARILGYNPESNTLTLELIVPEVFSAEDRAKVAAAIAHLEAQTGGEMMVFTGPMSTLLGLPVST